MPKVSEEYRAERRAHILAAARRCFVRDGFHGTSMHDLVEEAGVSSGAVYRYFPSKDAVIEAIAAENLDQVVTVIRQSVEAGLNAEAAIGAVLGAGTGAAIASDGDRRRGGYYWYHDGCFIQRPDGAWMRVHPRYCD